ncbi:MAG: Alkaline phosphatase synthesis transcriptional regulatory protein PhoP [Syntrophorhabdus sp. PtaU1.Bin058]|nr:MAG: Alkaline phosphatase synthesis transcriptional regulatory protein PhoP [Syntrophorhabdus sp. PtaU1.Bin058]
MKEKILIVDDSEDIRILLRRILQAAGYEVAEAVNGEKALNEIAGLKPDMVLLDIVMPGISGYEVCETLKKMDIVADIPVIFLSARSEAADKVRGLEIGGADYITKPFDKGEVLARVENQLKIRRLTNELIKTNVELTDKQRRLDEDLKAAAGIQQSLLPRTIPDVKNLMIAWKFMPSYMIGGDIFNVFRLDESHIGLYMIDVSGHGVPSALVTVSVSQMLQPDIGYITKKKTYAPPGYEIVPPGTVLQTLDREYPISRFEKYFTVVYMIIDTKNGTLAYSNAAHPPPVILHRDRNLELLDKGGTIIGLDGIIPFDEEQKTLERGDKVVLYTDGIVEYQNGDGAFFGEDRFYSLLNSLRNESVEDLLDGVVGSINDFGKGKEFQDDITIVAIEYGDKKE